MFYFLNTMVTKKTHGVPAFLHFAGIFLILFKGHLALLEISGLLCPRFSTSARDTQGKRMKFHINV